MARRLRGSQVIRGVLENLPSSLAAPLVAKLLPETVGLCGTVCGTLVVQHVIDHGTSAQRQETLDFLAEEFRMKGSESTHEDVLRSLHIACSDGLALLWG